MKYFAFNSADYDSRGFNLADSAASGQLASAVKRDSADGENANLEPFFNAGGKLILYHGWSDPALSPLATVNYYTSVGKQLHLTLAGRGRMRACSWCRACIIAEAVPVPTFSIL